MKSLKLLFVGLMLLTLNACQLFRKEVPVPVTVHPSRPAPVESVKMENLVTIEVDGEVKVAMDLNDFEALQSFFIDYIRFMKSNNALLCFYRQDLQESECQPVQ